MCDASAPAFVRAVAYGAYDGPIREAIHALKYQRIHAAAGMLGELLAEAVGQLAADAPAEMIVVPVPLFGSKRRQRGFNQARALAESALRVLRRSHPEWRLTLQSGVLRRVRATASQAGLTPRQRRMNLRGAFQVKDPKAVQGRHVLVVDDIFTTGATARAASRALVAAGAASVWVATLARAERLNINPRNAMILAHGAERGSSGIVPAGVSQLASISSSSSDQPSF